MIIIEHRFIIINMFVIIEFYHSGLVIMESFDQTSLSLCWCKYAQVLPVALLWENKWECLIMKGFWTPRIFYLQVKFDGTGSSLALLSLVRYGRLTAQSKGDQFFYFTSTEHHLRNTQYVTFMPVLIHVCDGLPCCHQKATGFGIWSRIKDIMDNLQTFKKCIKNFFPPSRIPIHIHSSLST